MTIMLNWIVVLVGQLPLRLGRAAAERDAGDAPISEDVAETAQLPTFWGDPASCRGSTSGSSSALAALVVYCARAEPDDARLRGARGRLQPRCRALRRHQRRAELLPRDGDRRAFAGIGGAVDILGWQYRSESTTIQASTIGFIGIAVALLGRNTAIGVGLAALLFGALADGTSRATSIPRSSSRSWRAT